MSIAILTNISPQGIINMLLIHIKIYISFSNHIIDLTHVHESQVAFGHKTSDIGIF
jgi:hypothetical protein